jgi:hypothetical protein
MENKIICRGRGIIVGVEKKISWYFNRQMIYKSNYNSQLVTFNDFNDIYKIKLLL